MAFSSEGSLTCHTWCDMRHRFIWSHRKEQATGATWDIGLYCLIVRTGAYVLQRDSNMRHKDHHIFMPPRHWLYQWRYISHHKWMCKIFIFVVFLAYMNMLKANMFNSMWTLLEVQRSLQGLITWRTNIYRQWYFFPKVNNMWASEMKK
jgi:hypothetical protein